jgi:hypothetical protein
MDLELSKEDFVLLKQILERYVSDLRMEIAGTENADWRKEMHVDEDRAKAMLERLNAAEPREGDAHQMQILVRGFVLIAD